MFTKKLLVQYAGELTYNGGKQLAESDAVGALDIETESDGMTTVHATIREPRYNEENETYVTFGDDYSRHLSARCTCTYARVTRRMCAHMIAVLLEYERHTSSLPMKMGSAKLDPRLLELMQNIADASEPEQGDPVVLQPILSFPNDTDQPSVKVEFRIGRRKSRSYVLKNIRDFCKNIEEADTVKYGKSLEFRHTISAFDEASRPMVHYLQSLVNKDDRFTPDRSSSGYYSYYGYMSGSSDTPDRSLVLKGRFLDAFFEAAEGLELLVQIDDKTENMTICDEKPVLPVKMMQKEQGYLLSGSDAILYRGHKMLYYFDADKNLLYRFPYDDAYVKLSDYFRELDQPVFVPEGYLQQFSRYLYPVIVRNTVLQSDGFDPLDYAPMKPEFEIYLDMPQDSVITCELYAVYGEKKYNTLIGISGEDRRDEMAEKKMDSFVSRWFNAFDSEKNRLVLSQDDDKLFALLSEGIPEMQKSASVFISDALKRLQIHTMPAVSVGISVSHNLLQVNSDTDAIDRARLAEVLSRYERKKKYYRLKSGEFVTVDNGNIEELLSLAEDLSISPSALAKGNVELPQYRALYLEKYAQMSDMLTEDDSFRSLIHRFEEVSRNTYDIPKSFHGELRPYQVEGFKWLCRLHDNGFGALLADEMGLGKTIQLIAFLGSLKDRKRCLIVCPASLVYNWFYEIQNFMPQLPCVVVAGTAMNRMHAIQESPEDAVLITSYDALKRDFEHYSEMRFSCQVVDEAQYIKNANTQAAQSVKMITSDFKVALTGTPIENKLSELWSIFDYLMPGFFGSYNRFRDTFERRIVVEHNTQAEQRLRDMITPFVLRRLKKDVLQDLPDKIEEVYYARLESEQKEIYEAHADRLRLKLSKQSDEDFNTSKLEILAELMKLRQICCDPSLFLKNYHAGSAKTDLCMDTIRKAIDAGHKILLFSQFTSMLDILCKNLEKEHIAYHLLTGATKAADRIALVDQFQNDDVPVFCISLKAGGTGLNLTAADIVIHYDPWWNTAVENQASDRSHRIGQTNVVTVFRLILKDTIEDRILQLQKEKSDLSDRILSAEGISSASLSRQDLLKLI